jgi:hypothetical protein
MALQTMSEQDEMVLLTESTETKHPEYLICFDESKDLKDPLTIEEAENSPYWGRWLEAIHEENEALKAKAVYEEIDELPPGRKAVGSKFVFHIKRDKHGHVVHFKVRLVAQGFTHIPGQDFNHTFAPVV